MMCKENVLEEVIEVMCDLCDVWRCVCSVCGVCGVCSVCGMYDISVWMSMNVYCMCVFV